MDVFMNRAIPVNMPDGTVVQLKAGLNTDVADEVAQHWYVAAHSSEPPKPSAKEAAMAEEIEALRKRAEAAEAALAEANGNALERINYLGDQILAMHAERDGQAARADAAEAELKKLRQKAAKTEAAPAKTETPAIPSEPPPSA